MKKLSAGLICVILSVVIAVFTVGCGNSGGELTYTGSSQISSSNNQLPVTSTPSSEPVSVTESAETVVYQLTTMQGETVQVLSTTQSITAAPSMNYDPVTVPSMGTTYLNTTVASTTAYVPPTYSGTDTPVTTKPTTEQSTKPSATEKKIKYVDVNDTMTSTSGEHIIVLAKNDKFGKSIKSSSGTLTIECSENQLNAKYSVLKELDPDGYVQIKINIPSGLENIMESTSDIYASIKIAKGTIVSEDGVSNNEFRGTLHIN